MVWMNFPNLHTQTSICQTGHLDYLLGIYLGQHDTVGQQMSVGIRHLGSNPGSVPLNCSLEKVT